MQKRKSILISKIKYKIIFFITICIITNSSIIFSQTNVIIGNDSPFLSKSDWKKIELRNPNQFKLYIPNKKFFKPKIALSLSGGGARGIAHIGVIKALEQSSINFDYIAGTSMGAIVGGLYSSGYTTQDLEDIFLKNDWDEIFALIENTDRKDLIIDKKSLNDKSLIKLQFKNLEVILPQGLSFANKFNSILNQYFTNAIYPSSGNFDELKIPFRAVATDIIHGNTVNLKNGNIATAVRASSTIPLRHSPVKLDTMLLVDGGLMANIPVTSAIEEFHPNCVIAVDVTSPLFKESDLNNPWNVADQIVTVEIKKFSQKEEQKANFLIKPDLNNHLNNDFTNIDSLLIAGEIAGFKAASTIKEYINNYQDSSFASYLHANYFQNDTLIWNLASNIDLVGFSMTDSLTLKNLLNKNSIDLDIIKLINIINSIKFVNTYNFIKFSLNNNGLINQIIASQPPLFKRILLKNEIPSNLINFIDSLNYKYYSELLTQDLIEKLVYETLIYSRKTGYSYLRIDTISVNSNNGELEFFLNPGKIDNIIIKGNSSINDYLIKREITFIPGDILSAADFQTSLNNLMATGYFSFVDVYAIKNKNLNYDITIDVVEGGNEEAQLGIRADNERYLQASFDFIHQNILNKGSLGSINLSGGARNFNTSITLLNPRILTTQLTNKFQIYYDMKKVFTYQENIIPKQNLFKVTSIGEYQFDKIGATFSLGSQIERSGKFSFDLKYEFQRYYQIGQPLPNFYKLATFKFNFQYDSEDNSYFTNEGTKIQTYIESNLIPKTDFISYSKLFFSFKQSFSFLDRNTISIGLTVGAGDQTMPKPEYFSLGGENSFWGMKEDQSRGRQIFNSFLSYRYRVPVKSFFDMYFSLHLNSGRTWLTTETIKLSGFRQGIGLQYSIDTPLGPFNLGTSKAFFINNKNHIIWGEFVNYLSIGVRI